MSFKKVAADGEGQKLQGEGEEEAAGRRDRIADLGSDFGRDPIVLICEVCWEVNFCMPDLYGY